MLNRSSFLLLDDNLHNFNQRNQYDCQYYEMLSSFQETLQEIIKLAS